MEEITKTNPKNLNQNLAKGFKKTFNFTKKNYVIISIISFIVFGATSLWLLRTSIGVGAKALFDNYLPSYELVKNETYVKFYDNAFDWGERNYHVANRGVISIGNLEEVSKLEVLKANDVQFITQDRDKKYGNVTAWMEVSGEGTFVVNLKAAEFIVDNDRQYVLVRVPYPELTNIAIINTIERWFSDDWKDGSYREGVELFLRQRNEAIVRIQKSLMSNQYIYSSAQDVAKSMIANLVYQFNADIVDLVVEVEFID